MVIVSAVLLIKSMFLGPNFCNHLFDSSGGVAAFMQRCNRVLFSGANCPNVGHCLLLVLKLF